MLAKDGFGHGAVRHYHSPGLRSLAANYRTFKAFPGAKPSNAIRVTPSKPHEKGPSLSCSLPECISKPGFLKHKFPNIKWLFPTSPYTDTSVHPPNGLLPPYPFLAGKLQWGHHLTEKSTSPITSVSSD